MNETKNNEKPIEKPKKTFKTERLEIVLTPDQKNRWEEYKNDNNFPSLAQMIRFSVEEMIEGKLSRSSISQDPLEQEKKEIVEMKKIQDEMIDQLKEKMEEFSRIAKIKVNESLKGQILRHLEKSNYFYEDLAYVLNKPEADVVVCLNQLQKENLVIMNKNGSYGVID